MRKDLKKLLFLGMERDKTLFFEEAQKMGLIQFIDSRPAKISKGDGRVQLLSRAIRIVRGLPPQETKELPSQEEALRIAEKMVDDHVRFEAIDSEIRTLNLEIQRIHIFGDFNFDDLAYLERRGLIFQFFCAKHGYREELEDQEGLSLIGSEHGLDYYLWIGKEPLSDPRLIEMKIDRSLSDLRMRKEQIQNERRKLEEDLQKLACFNAPLHHALLQEMDAVNLQEAEEGVQTAMDQHLFIATGWIPEDKLDAIQRLCKSTEVHFEEIAIEPEDRVPTYLENQDVSRIGEDLVHIYDTPSTTDKDPSLWVFSAFLIFFSIIIGDGGYGSVFLGLALYLRYKLPNLKGAKKRALNLFTFLSVGCIVWGILSSSFFGISLSPENPLHRFSLVHYLVEKKIAYHVHHEDAIYGKWVQSFPAIQGETEPHQVILKGFLEKGGERVHELLSNLTDQVLLELALFIGVIHIILGMLRYLRKNWSYLGWILFLVGAYLYFPVFLGAPSILNYLFHIPFEAGGEVGLQLIFIGIISAIAIAIFRNGIFGLTEIMNLLQVFADTLSYLRLYALGLSGAILSTTINEMASNVPFLLGVVLIVVGHLINMVLGVMGGVIQGLRLNFLEWYHYSFEGGGRQFKPLILTEKHHEL